MPDAGARRSIVTWSRVVLAVAGVMTALDAVLLQLKRSFFTGGFLAADHLRSSTEAVLFLLLSFAGDAAVIGALTFAGFAAARLLRLRGRASVLLAAAVPLFVLVVADIIAYRLLAHLGDAFDLGLMFDLTGKSVAEVFAVSAAQVAGPALGIVAAAMAIGLTVFAVNRWDRRAGIARATDRLRPLGARAAVLLLIGLALTTTARLTSAELDNGLRRKPSTKALGAIVETLTDVDRDGYGIVRAPADPAPFDKRIYPYAVEVPGNGIDENGVAGDMPAGAAAFAEGAVPSTRWRTRPDVVLVVLESFRADVVGSTHGGRAVTPTMDGIASRGVRSQTAFSHNGYTAQSRYHLMTGRLTGPSSSTSLLDDFQAYGYHVGYFSGQDDSFGGPEFAVSTRAADRMFDARQAKAERYSTFSTAGSLAVPASTVLKHVNAFLQERPTDAPLFLYVNFHDTHYPYHHNDITAQFASTPLRQSEIVPSRRDELYASYLDAAHYVDAAVGALLSRVRASSGREPAVIVIGDHGESLFDDTFLGHGYALNDPQTRIPLLASGLALQIDEPFGQADLRATVLRALSAADAQSRPTARPVAGKKVFQYLGTLNRPRQISFVSQDKRISFDFRSRQVCVVPGQCVPADGLAGAAREQFNELVWTWEAMAAWREHPETWE